MTDRIEELDSRTLFEGRVIQLKQKRYRAEGEEYEREMVTHPGAVGVLAYDDEVVHLVSQPREAVGEESSLEIPAGMIDPGDESPLACAKRELAEESGLAAASWRQLHSIQMTPGYSDEVLVLFEATDLSEASAEPDEEERIEQVRLPLAELDGAIESVRDAKTLIALLSLRSRL